MTEPLRPVQVFFPDWSPRRVNDNCRAGKIPGAVKYGKVWMIRESDLRSGQAAKAEASRPKVPTVEEAMAELRRRGMG